MASPAIFTNEYTAIKNCRHGTFLYNTNDTFIGRSLDLYGEWCEPEFERLKQVLKPSQLVLDIGANIGTHTVFFGKQVGPQGVVMAFEPQRLVYQNLCANVALNNLVNVSALHAGVGDLAKHVLMPVYNPRQQWNFGSVKMDEDTPQGEPVAILRIDDLRLLRCDLMKIDVEGMEGKVLAGAKDTIQRFKPVLFIENDSVERSPEILAMVNSLGYTGYWQIASYYNPNNFFNNPHNVFEKIKPQSNICCFPAGTLLDVQGLEPIAGPSDDWRQAAIRMNQRRK